MNKRPSKIVGDIAYVYLTKDQVAIIDADDVGRVDQYTWQAVWSISTQSYYVQTSKQLGGLRGFGLQRLIMHCTDPKLKVDHKDHNTLDNRKENLRIVTHKQNMENALGARKNSQSKILGVYRERTYSHGRLRVRWRACVKHSGKKHRKYFPYTPQGLADADAWVTMKRLEIFTHSDGR